ncbi:ankyrin-3 [Heracleum sosnowskyi]|uniref:Ankyrin-3 n=1 Tax=Heracleum sosnowskyi TaxID=360622 RepID=A0AAD8HN45_9APIA|nr:ankyrin-3 [Heracleum sosnowskyi]
MLRHSTVNFKQVGCSGRLPSPSCCSLPGLSNRCHRFAHTGNLPLVNTLLNIGADVNQKLFRGFSTTAAAREGHQEILQILLKAGASQPACEETLLEASCHGHARSVDLLMGSDLIRPHIALHALFTACCRGFVDLVNVLMKYGVDANSMNRVLLSSSKPSLHTNIDCTALDAAIVSRHVAVVCLLLQAGARTDTKVQLGAWSWDMASGKEFRVGAGLAESYPITWLAVEYFESSGTILHVLLQHVSLNTFHLGRTLLHHAILCGNARAANLLLDSGAQIETPFKTSKKGEFRSLHMAVRLRSLAILQCLIASGCDLNARTHNGETALMICVKHKQEECLKLLAKAGSDFGLVDIAGQSASSLAESNQWYPCYQEALRDVIGAGMVLKSSKISIFSPLMFLARSGDVHALNALIGHGEINLDDQDDKGFSAVMVAAREGHVEAFRFLVYAGADVKLINKSGETAVTLSRLNPTSHLFEKVMFEFALEKGNRIGRGFYVLHYAARHGDFSAVKLLTGRGYDINVFDGDGNTPLMLSARGGHASICQLLISQGARCDIKNSRGETALSLARKAGHKLTDVEHVILDQISRDLVLEGAIVWKHTREGKGGPHKKFIKIVGTEGVLRWGNSTSRNVICQDAQLRPSNKFRKLRQSKGDADRPWAVSSANNKEKGSALFVRAS